MDRTTAALEELLEAVRKLRGPCGCSWDRSQTLKSLRPYMLEEAYEVADAVDSGDMDELRKELGDLLLHIVMSAEICREQGIFDLAEVASRITEKLVRRHPHVFDGTTDLTPEEVEKQWEAIKSQEKKKEKKRFFDSIPESMPALQKAWRIQQRASEIGFPWPGEEDLLAKVKKDIQNGDPGDLLFGLVNLLRIRGVEPEQALREANTSFMQGFHRLEELLGERGVSLHDAGEAEIKECAAIVFKKR